MEMQSASTEKKPRKENKTFLPHTGTGLAGVNKCAVKIWPQWTQTVTQTEKWAGAPRPPTCPLSSKSHSLGCDSSLPSHTDETERTSVSDIRLGIAPVTCYPSFRSHCLASGVRLHSHTHWAGTGGRVTTVWGSTQGDPACPCAPAVPGWYLPGRKEWDHANAIPATPASSSIRFRITSWPTRKQLRLYYNHHGKVSQILHSRKILHTHQRGLQAMPGSETRLENITYVYIQ